MELGVRRVCCVCARSKQCSTRGKRHLRTHVFIRSVRYGDRDWQFPIVHDTKTPGPRAGGKLEVFMHFVQPILVATLVLLAAAQQTYAGVQQTYYVSPTGNDNNPGTQSLPFQTIAHARDQVRLIQANMTGDIVVYLRG